MAKTKLGRDTEATPQQAFVDDPITLEPGSVAMTLTDAGSGATGTVEIEVPADNGFSGINVTSADGDDAGSEVKVTSTTVSGEALVNVKADAGDGTATARLDAQVASVPGVAVAGFAATFGATVVGITASASDGAPSLTVLDGAGVAGEPGQALLASATLGSEWSDLPDPLTSVGAIVISGHGGAVLVTLGADDSITFMHNAGALFTLGADGSFEVNGSGVVRILGLPTADPVAAGQLWNDTGVVKVSAG